MEENSDTEIMELDDEIKLRIFLVENYWLLGKSPKAVLRACLKEFGKRNEPSLRTISHVVQKFHQFGTVHDLRKGRAGRKTSVVTPENVERVQELYAENPSTSQRQASRAIGISKTSVSRILKTKLDLFPYKIQVHQELNDYDMARRKEFAQILIKLIEDNNISPGKIWFSDEAHFWLSGYVNKQNYRFWGKEPPRIFETTSKKPQRVTVWCAVCYNGILGPYFFDGNVNGEKYLQMLKNYFVPNAQGHQSVEGFYYMQDGALPHRTSAVFEYLDEHFPGRVIGLGYKDRYGEGYDWPPYSPDLNPLDFWLWGYLKDEVYKRSPKTIEEMKTTVQNVIAKIGENTRRSVLLNWRNRLVACIEADGGHIETFQH